MAKKLSEVKFTEWQGIHSGTQRSWISRALGKLRNSIRSFELAHQVKLIEKIMCYKIKIINYKIFPWGQSDNFLWGQSDTHGLFVFSNAE